MSLVYSGGQLYNQQKDLANDPQKKDWIKRKYVLKVRLLMFPSFVLYDTRFTYVLKLPRQLLSRTFKSMRINYTCIVYDFKICYSSLTMNINEGEGSEAPVHKWTLLYLVFYRTSCVIWYSTVKHTCRRQLEN